MIKDWGLHITLFDPLLICLLILSPDKFPAAGLWRSHQPTPQSPWSPSQLGLLIV